MCIWRLGRFGEWNFIFYALEVTASPWKHFIFNFHIREKYQLQNKCKKYSQICRSYKTTHLSEPAPSIILAAFSFYWLHSKTLPSVFFLFWCIMFKLSTFQGSSQLLPVHDGVFKDLLTPTCALVVVAVLSIQEVFILSAASTPCLHFVYSCTFY